MKLIEKFKKIGSSVFGFIFRIILIVSSENWQKVQKKKKKWELRFSDFFNYFNCCLLKIGKYLK